MGRSTIVKTSAPYLAVVVSFWCIYKLMVKPFLSPLRKIPGRPYRPIVGNMLEAMKAEAMTNTIKWMKEYKSRIVRYYFFYGQARLLVADPEVAKYILVTNSKNYKKINTLALQTIVPNFVLTLSGEKHHALRKILNPAFNSKCVNEFIPIFDDMSKKVVNIWSNELANCGSQSTVVPAQDFMSRLSLDIICRCGFDFEMRSIDEPTSAGVQSFKRILKGLQIRLSKLLPLQWLPTKKNKLARADFQFFKGTINSIVAMRRQRMQNGETSSSKDLLSLLMDARDENGHQMNEALISSQVGGFLFAGFETTSMNLTWTLLLLAQHPEVQEKARQEVMSLLPDSSQPITAKTVEELKYLTCVIKESLRLYPPVSVIFRASLRDDELSGYFVPAGTPVGISVGALHRLPENWEDPEDFKPERFLNDYDHYKFLPFGAGPYMCIGHIFSISESKVALARLLRSFRLALPEGYRFRRIRQLTLQPKPPLSLSISAV